MSDVTVSGSKWNCFFTVQQHAAYYKSVFIVTWRKHVVRIVIFVTISILFRGPGSSVGIATELRAGRSGVESRWGRDFPPVQTGPGAHPASCTVGTGSFSGIKRGRGVLLTTHPLLVSRSWKRRAIPLPTLWATPGLERNYFTFTFTLIVFYLRTLLVTQIVGYSVELIKENEL